MSLPLEFQRLFQLKPLGFIKGVFCVAPLWPLSRADKQIISQCVGNFPVEEVPTDRVEILKYLRQISASLQTVADDADFSLVFAAALIDAAEQQASDVHLRYLNTVDTGFLRLRIHGNLLAPVHIRSVVIRRLLTWVKQQSGLDSSEHRKPQEGRFTLSHDALAIEFRVSCSGQADGETMVIRVLDPRNRFSLESLFSNTRLLSQLRHLVDLSSKQGGLVLVSGPTGAGKTTTLAALTAALPLHRLKVVAIEDPVEIRTPGVDHLEVDGKHGLGFAPLLRAVLRQDPDVIVIGEIRDSETAEIALRAVETGHWVMASVHAGSVLETVHRLFSLLSDGYKPLGRMTLENRLYAVLNQILVPSQQKRSLSIEAAFAQDRKLAVSWLNSDLNLDWHNCVYFPR